MKLLTMLFLTSLMVTVSALSQISITRSDIPLKLDEAVYYKDLTSSSLTTVFNNVNPGQNQTWDFTGISLGSATNDEIDHSNPVNSPFPDASYWYEYGYSFFYYTVPSKEYDKIDDTGIYKLGFTVDTMYIDLGTVSTGGYVSIPNQKVYYGPAYQLYKLPITYNYPATDTTRSLREIKAYLNMPLFGINNANVSFYIHYQRTVSTTGWGKINLPGYRPNMDVLLLHIRENMTDSIFINNQPAPQTLLDLVGIQQGNLYYYDVDVFYAKGYSTPLLIATKYYDNSVLTNSFGSMYLNPDTSGVKDVNDHPMNATAYPNPANGDLKIKFNKLTDAPYMLKIYNASSTQVRSYTIDNPAGEVVININFGSETPDGIYFYNILDNQMKSIYTGKVALVR